MRIGGLFKCPTTNLNELACGDGVWELDHGCGVRTDCVLICVDRGLWIAFVVVLELPQISNGVDAEAGADNRLIILEWTKRKTYPRINVAKVQLPEAGCQTLLAV